MVLLCLVIFATEQMTVNSFRKLYDGPFDAVVGLVGIAVEYAMKLGAPDILAVLVIGGGLAGLLTEWAARRWT